MLSWSQGLRLAVLVSPVGNNTDTVGLGIAHYRGLVRGLGDRGSGLPCVERHRPPDIWHRSIFQGPEAAAASTKHRDAHDLFAGLMSVDAEVLASGPEHLDCPRDFARRLEEIAMDALKYLNADDFVYAGQDILQGLLALSQISRDPDLLKANNHILLVVCSKLDKLDQPFNYKGQEISLKDILISRMFASFANKDARLSHICEEFVADALTFVTTDDLEAKPSNSITGHNALMELISCRRENVATDPRILQQNTKMIALLIEHGVNPAAATTHWGVCDDAISLARSMLLHGTQVIDEALERRLTRRSREGIPRRVRHLPRPS